MTHLWEHHHPYYCQEGNYFCSGDKWNEVHFEYDSWEEFFEVWGHTDPDLNLLFRWDWWQPDPTDYDEDERRQPGFQEASDQLQLYFMLQRKALCKSIFVNVTKEDEPEIRKWLTKRAETMCAIWEPLMWMKPQGPFFGPNAVELQPADQNETNQTPVEAVK